MFKSLFVPIAALALLASVACGGDDDPETPTPTVPATVTTPGATNTTPAGSVTPGATATRTTPAASPTTGVTPINGSPNPVTKPAVPANLAGTALLKDVRIGLHPETASERIVFEFEGTGLPPVKVEYVTEVRECGPGEVVNVAGEATLSVVFSQAAQHNEQGQLTFPSFSLPGNNAPIAEAREFCDFEAMLGWAVGVPGQRPFVVTQLANPPRLVIDIAK